jgi:hypothetical protein
MDDIRKLSEIGHNGPSGFRTSPARRALIPLRLIVGYGFVPHGFAKQSRGPEAFAIFPQQAARECDRAIYSGEVKNG